MFLLRVQQDNSVVTRQPCRRFLAVEQPLASKVTSHITCASSNILLWWSQSVSLDHVFEQTLNGLQSAVLAHLPRMLSTPFLSCSVPAQAAGTKPSSTGTCERQTQW